jgi:hypothetical protein
MQLRPNYIIDSNNNKIAVQLDIQTYEKIIDTLENYSLYHYMADNKDDEKFSLTEAQKYYQSLKNNANRV